MPKKSAGRRDECHDGLLFPPERRQHPRSREGRKKKVKNIFSRGALGALRGLAPVGGG